MTDLYSPVNDPFRRAAQDALFFRDLADRLRKQLAASERQCDALRAEVERLTAELMGGLATAEEAEREARESWAA